VKDIDSYERSVAQADEALRLMVEQRCPPTPRNYAIWFTYAGGDNPTLVEAVDRAVAQAGTLTEDDASRIHDLFLAPRTDEQEMRELSVQLKGEMDGVLDMIEAARGRATDYGRELGNMSAELDGADDFSSVRAIVTTLVTATREMEQYNSELKQHLQVSRAQISELNRSLETALIESRTDPLTGITNRKGFHEKLDRLALESAQDGDGELCLLLGDIDHFKKFNDSYGHQTGDQVLKLVASCITTVVGEHGIAARFGGEEFAVLLPDTTLEQAVAIANRIRKTLMSKRLIRKSTGRELGFITMSWGVARHRAGEDPEALICRADACLYTAKRGGRNRVRSETDPETANRRAA